MSENINPNIIESLEKYGLSSAGKRKAEDAREKRRAKAAADEDPTTGVELLFQEVFMETSSGDVGLQVKDGPLFRVHSSALEKIPGLLDQVRSKLKPMPLWIETKPLPTKSWFKKRGNKRIVSGIAFSMFAEDRHSKRTDVVKLGGYTTANAVSGTTGALQVKDPLRLAERYEINEDAERIVELLRFVYLGYIEWFAMQPKSSEDKKSLLDNMVAMLFLANRFAVDELFTRLMSWFPSSCRQVCGDHNFCDAYYKIEYYWRNVVEEPLFRDLMKNALLDMGCVRGNLMLISWDERWNGLDTTLLSILLDNDKLQIVNEGELLTLIERWNSNRDKEAEEILLLCRCFRQTPENIDQLILCLTNMGIMTLSNQKEGKNGGPVQVSHEELRNNMVRQLAKLLPPNYKPIRGKHTHKKKKEKKEEENKTEGEESEAGNALGAVLKQAQTIDVDDEELDHFVLMQREKDSFQYAMQSRGLAFTVGPNSTCTQMMPITEPGCFRIRLAFTQKLMRLWAPAHSVFIGIVYNDHCFSGYMCGISSYLGVYEIRAVSAVAAKPEKPVFLTGSGNKVEFDVDLIVEMGRVNGVVGCNMGVVVNNSCIARDDFQITKRCLSNEGVRFQLVPIGLQQYDQLDVRISWILGGGQKPAVDETSSSKPA